MAPPISISKKILNGAYSTEADGWVVALKSSHNGHKLKCISLRDSEALAEDRLYETDLAEVVRRINKRGITCVKDETQFHHLRRFLGLVNEQVHQANSSGGRWLNMTNLLARIWTWGRSTTSIPEIDLAAVDRHFTPDALTVAQRVWAVVPRHSPGLPHEASCEWSLGGLQASHESSFEYAVMCPLAELAAGGSGIDVSVFQKAGRVITNAFDSYYRQVVLFCPEKESASQGEYGRWSKVVGYPKGGDLRTAVDFFLQESAWRIVHSEQDLRSEDDAGERQQGVAVLGDARVPLKAFFHDLQRAVSSYDFLSAREREAMGCRGTGILHRQALGEPQPPSWNEYYRMRRVPVVEVEPNAELVPSLDRESCEAVRGCVFRLRKRGEDRGVLLGSCHMVPAQMLKFRRAIREGLEEADLVLNEDGAFRSSDDYLWGAHLRMTQEGEQWGYMDATLSGMAVLAGKKLEGLEAKEFDLTKWLREPDPASEADFNQASQGIQRQAAELYAEGGLEKLTDAFISSTALMRRYIIRPEVGEEFRKSILEDRNQQHANGILKALKRYPRCKIFAFVGAGHLSDVLKLLREAGYECVSI